MSTEAGIETAIGCHTFRVTGITAYLEMDGKFSRVERPAFAKILTRDDGLVPWLQFRH